MEKIKISDINLLGEIAKQLKLPTTAIINGIENLEDIAQLTLRDNGLKKIFDIKK